MAKRLVKSGSGLPNWQERDSKSGEPKAESREAAGRTVPIFVAGRHKNGTVPLGPALRLSPFAATS